jgi:hypothetical protein
LANPDGLLFVGEKSALFRRSTFGRKRRKAREICRHAWGLPVYDLRYTGHTLPTADLDDQPSGANLARGE